MRVGRWFRRFVGSTSGMRSDAAQSGESARVWFLVNDAFVALVLALTANPLSDAFQKGRWGYAGPWLALGVASVVLYMSVGAVGPGFVARPRDRRRVRRRRLREYLPLDGGHSSTDARDGAGVGEGIPPAPRLHDPVRLRERPRVVRGALEQRPPPEHAPQHYCQYCRVTAPVRSKHCHKCQRCVHRFDHHCFWVAACVGERNHAIFVWFLAAQSAVCMWTAAIAWRALETSPSDPAGGWWLHHAPLIALLLDAGGMGMLPTGLLFYHLYLAVTGKTTWEDLKTEHISYLEGFQYVNPFDRGLIGNLKALCCVFPYRPRVWDYEPEKVALASHTRSRRDVTVCDNPWSNKYYDCC